MAYYCGECIVWRGSSDENKYGERWCSYSRRYESSDQNTYGCKGFLYAGRAVLTKICEILNLDKQLWFAAFDRVKEAYVAPEKMELLVNYCSIAPGLVSGMEKDENKVPLAQKMLEEYLNPAMELCQGGMYREAAETYREMVKSLKKYFAEKAE